MDILLDIRIRMAALLVLGLLSTAVSVDENPEVHTILEGNNLTIACNVTPSTDITIYWTKNDTKSSFLQNGVNLEFTSITRNASGDYICHSVNTLDNGTEWNRTVEVVTVNVEYPAEISIWNLTPTIVHENQTFNVTCRMEGNPVPTWEIRNDVTGTVVMSGHGVATVTSGPNPAVCTDHGKWVCTGYNSLNKDGNVTAEGFLTVNSAPRPLTDPTPPPYEQKVLLGTDAFLYMELCAFPVPDYTWSRDDGQPMPARVVQYDFNSTTALNISDVHISDYGKYILIMSNIYGNYTAEYQLNARGKPQVPTNFRASNQTEQSVILTWTSGYDMGSQQRFMVCQRIPTGDFIGITEWLPGSTVNHGLGQNMSYTERLVEGRNYTFSVLAENADGNSNLTRPFVTVFTNSTQPQKSQGGKTSTGVIVGSVLGSCALLAGLAIIVYLLKYKRTPSAYKTMGSRRVQTNKVGANTPDKKTYLL